MSPAEKPRELPTVDEFKASLTEPQRAVLHAFCVCQERLVVLLPGNVRDDAISQLAQLCARTLRAMRKP